MNQLSERYLNTGGDPRALPSYASLRDELSKRSHPARPDVSWPLVQKHCLALFEQNGVELQTLACYTQARMQLAGLSGLNEGLEILEALINYQWEVLWPPQAHARVEILTDLSRRLQKMMRTLPLSYSDLNLDQLYLAEEHLARLNKALQRREVKHLCQFDTLASLVQNIMIRLENHEEVNTDAVIPQAETEEAEEKTIVAPPPLVPPVDVTPSPVVRQEKVPQPVKAGVKKTVVRPSAVPPAGVTPSPVLTQEEAPDPVRWIYVAQPKVEVLKAMKPGAMAWRPFVAGLCVMLAAGGTVLLGWDKVFPPNPLLVQLQASVTPFATPLSPDELASLSPGTTLPENLVEQTQQQLAEIEKFGPDWPVEYGHQLVQQVKALKPEDDATKKLALMWQQQLNVAALSANDMSGWHQGMEQLQQLTAKLNALDSQRGKYITVSELKSVVYTATQAFNRSIPVEEQLRLFAATPSDIHRRQAEIALEQLQKRYFLLRQEQDAVTQ